MEDTTKNLISCVRASLHGEQTDCDFVPCLKNAYRHGVTNLIYYSVASREMDASLKANLKRQTYAAAVREIAQQNLTEEIYRCFEASKIRCVALKGIVLKYLYPKPEMRYMSDIDLVIDPSKAALVRDILENLGCSVINYDCGETDAYRSAEGLNLEIKKTLALENFNEQSGEFLGKILDMAEPMQGFQYVCSLPNEEHYAYVLCHIVKHMLCGGVGIRPIMDVWICRKHMPLDGEKVFKLLEQLELTAFAQTIEHLAEVWFGDAEPTPIDDELGEYILSSGSFGTEAHKVADRMLVGGKGKNRFTYLWKRFFLPYSSMCRYYPVLKKWAILLPVFWIWRAIYALLFRRGRLKAEVTAVGNTNEKMLRERLDFYHRCGIVIDEK